jgi:hypothetical protein
MRMEGASLRRSRSYQSTLLSHRDAARPAAGAAAAAESVCRLLLDRLNVVDEFEDASAHDLLVLAAV